MLAKRAAEALALRKARQPLKVGYGSLSSCLSRLRVGSEERSTRNAMSNGTVAHWHTGLSLHNHHRLDRYRQVEQRERSSHVEIESFRPLGQVRQSPTQVAKFAGDGGKKDGLHYGASPKS